MTDSLLNAAHTAPDDTCRMYLSLVYTQRRYLLTKNRLGIMLQRVGDFQKIVDDMMDSVVS